MKRSSLTVPGGLVVLSCLLLGLPSAWTDAARFYILGLVRTATESPGPPAPPPPSDDPAEPMREQNQILTQRLARLQEENAQLRTELQNFKDFRREARGDGWELIPAPIPVLLSRDPSSWNRTLLIARGSDDGVSPEDPVVWGPRFLGRVHKVVGPRVSQVRLVTDRGFRTPVVVATGRADAVPTEPLTGILEGQGLDTCALQWIMQDAHIEVGWPVLTLEDPLSNTPPHLLIGRVCEVEPQAGPFLRVRVRPAIRFSSLSQVHVYKKRGATPPASPPAAPTAPGPRRPPR
jgi:rod shape-determining protein MreC